MELNGYMKTAMVLIIGVILIAGVVTPVIASVSDDSGSGSSASYKNTDGSPLMKVSDLMEMYRLGETGDQAYGITNYVDGTAEQGAFTYVTTYPEEGEDQTTYTEITYPLDNGAYIIPLLISPLVYVYWQFDTTIQPSSYEIVVKWSDGNNIMYDYAHTDQGEYVDVNFTEGILEVGTVDGGQLQYQEFSLTGTDLEQSFIYHPKGDWRAISFMSDSNGTVTQTLKWTDDDMYMFSTGNDLEDNWLYCKPYPASWSDIINTMPYITPDSYEYVVYDIGSDEPTQFDESNGVKSITMSADMTKDVDVRFAEGADEIWCGSKIFIAPEMDGSGSGGGASGTTMALLTTIPIVMLAGLMLITVRAFIKKE